MGWSFNPFSGNFDNTGPNTTPAGSSGQIQFNNSGAFGASAYLFWDDTNNAMGIQTNTPFHALHVVGETGTTINNVVTASVTQTTETLATSPTGTITEIAEFAALSGSSTSQNLSGSGYTASGQVIDYRISQAVLGYDNNFYISALNENISFTDTLGDSSPFSVVITFGTPDTECTYYYIEKQIDGAGYNFQAVVPVNSTYEDSNFSSNQSASAWPTYYSFSYTTPTAPNTLSGQEINVGSGTLTESGITYDFQIRSATSSGGLYWCEQTGDSGSFTDANMGQQFDLQVDWAPGTGDEQVIRISSDGGSTWNYNFVGGMGSSFVWTNQGNDTAAEAAWSRDVAGISATYSFKTFARNLSPSGNTVYSQGSTTYSKTLTTPGTNYIFKHTLSANPANGIKLLADYNSGVTNGLIVTSGTTVYDIGYGNWTDGTIVTPTTYAFSSGTTRYFKLVGYNGTIYSPTPLVVSHTTTGGNDKYFSGTFSYPSGVTIVKILISTDGSTYTGSKTFNSPTGSFTFDATDATWVGNTTINPTASVPSTHRIDRSQSSLTDVPHLSITDISGSGDRYMSIGFGIANNKSSAISSYLCKITAQAATGYLLVGASQLIGYANASFGSVQWRLGSSYDFNLDKSSSKHFTVWAGNASNPTAYFYAAGDSNRGTTYFGQQTSSFGTNSKVVICPTAGGTTALHFRRTSGFTGDNILIDSNGSFIAGWGQEGRMFLNATAISSTTWLRIGGSNSGSQIRLEQHGVSSASTNGDLWHDPTRKFLTGYYQGIKQFVQRNLISQVTTVTVANTTTETTLLSTTSADGTFTLPADFLVAGRTIKLDAWGYHSSTASPTLRIRFKLGSTTICETGTHTVHNVSNKVWRCEVVLTCRSAGSSGTVFAQGFFEDETDFASMVTTATATVNTTTSQAVNLTAQWSAASASNTISCSNVTLEVLS